jgi:uncharacterized protein (TIGR01244 family)
MASATHKHVLDEHPVFGTGLRDVGVPSRGSGVDTDAPARASTPPPGGRRSKFSPVRLRWLVPAAILVTAVGYQMGTESTYFTSYAANALFRYNFHPVVPGRLYRSAQMPRDALAETIREYGIRTVIDLRLTEDASDETGLSEAEAARRAGADYRHIPFSSARVDQRASLLALLAAYRELPPPLLVHCSSGTHRAGVAAAAWLIDQAGWSPDRAAEQLTMKYGFFRPERDLKAFLQGRPTLDRVIRAYSLVRDERNISFRDWVAEPELFDDSTQSGHRE